MRLIDAAKRKAGEFISKVGGMASIVAGKDLRIGGGIGAGATLAGRSTPFFNVNQPQASTGGQSNQIQSKNPVIDNTKKTPVVTNNPKVVTTNNDQGGGSQGQQDQGQNYNVPSPSDAGVPSAEDKARQASEERMRRYGEVVAPVQKDIESYLSSRPSIVDLFKTQMDEQGVSGKRANLDLLEGEVGKLGTQLNTIPNEEIARRKETGMLTSAAERRIRAKEEAPYREQLLKTTDAANQQRVGLDRAYQLVDKYLDVLKEQELREVEPLETKLKGAQAEFGQEVEGLAARLTGFKADREAKLIEYEKQIAADIALSTAQRKEAADLKLQEAKHLNTMQEISAREKGQDASLTNPEQIEEFKTDMLSMGNEELVSKWGEIMGVDSLNYLLKKYQTIIPNGDGGGENLERPKIKR